MGQYHAVINLDRASGYTPKSLGGFVKLMEQAHSTVSPAALLFMLAGPWKGQKIAVVGDYAEDSDIPESKELTGMFASEIWASLHQKGGEGIKNVGWLPRKILEEEGFTTFTRHKLEIKMHGAGGTTTHPSYIYETTDPVKLIDEDDAEDIVIVNLDKNEKLDPKQFGDAGTMLATASDCGWGGTGTALYVLLAVSSVEGGRGGGDFRLEHELVGSWGGDRIAALPKSEVEGHPRDISVKVRTMLGAADEGRYHVKLNGTVDRLPPRWAE